MASRSRLTSRRLIDINVSLPILITFGLVAEQPLFAEAMGPGLPGTPGPLYLKDAAGTLGSHRTCPTRTQWGGLEYALGAGWSVKGEYLHMGFGTNGYNLTGSLQSPAGLTGVITTHVDVKSSFDIARVGVNYRF
jgi:hypothetical protein